MAYFYRKSELAHKNKVNVFVNKMAKKLTFSLTNFI